MSFAQGSMLEALPNELLDMVIEALAPSSLRLQSMWWAGVFYLPYKKSLHSLCLVSKTIEANARPALYRDIYLFNRMAVVHLHATFCADPTLASNVRSIAFSLHGDGRRGKTRTIDLRPLRPFQDPDYAFWTRGESKPQIRMPLKTREELVCILFSKVLSRIPALRSLHLELPVLRTIDPQCLKRIPGGAQLRQQLSLQETLMRDFCQGRSLPDLSRLSTVGMLGWQPNYDVKGLCDRLVRSPNLRDVFYAGDYLRTLHDYYDYYGPTTGLQHSTAEVFTSVKTVFLKCHFNTTRDLATLTKVFPSLEFLAFDRDAFWAAYNYPVHVHGLLPLLGGLKNLHTLELGHSPRLDLATCIMTETGPRKLVTFPAQLNLRTLLVRADFFGGFTLHGEDEEPQLYREPTVLPASLRHLTLLLDFYVQRTLAERGHIPRSEVTLVVEPLLREVAPALLDEYPHLERVGLCYHMDDYRENKVQTLAER